MTDVPRRTRPAPSPLTQEEVTALPEPERIKYLEDLVLAEREKFNALKRRVREGAQKAGEQNGVLHQVNPYLVEVGILTRREFEAEVHFICKMKWVYSDKEPDDEVTEEMLREHLQVSTDATRCNGRLVSGYQAYTIEQGHRFVGDERFELHNIREVTESQTE